MFVIIHNNSVILGPMRWNRFRFENTIQEECEVSTSLPDTNQLAIVVSADVKILPVQGTQDPVFNPRIEFLHGPFWEFTDTIAISSYQVEPYNIDAVKSQLKAESMDQRWKTEVAGTKSTIQGVEITISTSREDRHIFIQKFLLMADLDTVQWKFPEGWLTLTKSDLNQIVTTSALYVQQQFDWESTKIAEIESCESLQQLDAIIIVAKELSGAM